MRTVGVAGDPESDANLCTACLGGNRRKKSKFELNPLLTNSVGKSRAPKKFQIYYIHYHHSVWNSMVVVINKVLTAGTGGLLWAPVPHRPKIWPAIYLVHCQPYRATISRADIIFE